MGNFVPFGERFMGIRPKRLGTTARPGVISSQPGDIWPQTYEALRNLHIPLRAFVHVFIRTLSRALSNR